MPLSSAHGAKNLPLGTFGPQGIGSAGYGHDWSRTYQARRRLPRDHHRGWTVGNASWCPYTRVLAHCWWGPDFPYLLNRNQNPNHHPAQSQLGELDSGTRTPGLGVQGLMALTNSSNGKTPNDPNPKDLRTGRGGKPKCWLAKKEKDSRENYCSLFTLSPNSLLFLYISQSLTTSWQAKRGKGAGSPNP